MKNHIRLCRLVWIAYILIDLISTISAITTTHYSNPREVQEDQYFNVTLPAAERHKRLLPYMNFYSRQPYNQPYHQQARPNPQRYRILVGKQNQLQPLINKFNQVVRVNIQPPPPPQAVRQQIIKSQYTPFSENNALPGAFVPMKQNFQQNPQPNFNAIYEKLLQLKYSQQNLYKQYEQPGVNYVPDYQEAPPAKTIVHTYTPTQVDVPPPPVQYQQNYQQQNYQPIPIQIVPQFRKPIIILRPKQPDIEEKQRIFEEQLRIYEDQQQTYKNEQKLLNEQQKYLVYAPNLSQQNHYGPVQEFEQPPLPKYQPVIHVPTIQEASADAYVAHPNVEPTTEVTITTPEYPNHRYPITESPDNLGEILRKLQASNTLPQNLSPENIDNSIKTLVKILNMLRKHQRLSKKPIVVPDQEIETPQNVDTIIQTFPGDTVEGGTPGKPGIDYPALSNIPQTSFSCKTQRYKGFFGDPDTNCQVWHYCDFNGGQASFLCPNGTIFSQVALTCDWWYNVKCASTPQLYVLNERLYKYILPFSPKFPEDYSGPLVDRYLALKFQEMEEKMKKQRKKSKEADQNKNGDKDSSENSEIDDADQLQKQNEENRKNVGGEGIDFEGNNVRRSVS